MIASRYDQGRIVRWIAPILIGITVYSKAALCVFLPPSDHYIASISRQVSRGISSFSKNESSKSKAYARNYIMARQLIKANKGSTACKIFKELNSKQNFPLHDYVQIKILDTCISNIDEMNSWLKENSKNIPSWADENYLKIAYKKATEFNYKEFLALNSLKYERLISLQNDKIEFLKKSLEYAKEIKKPNLVKIIRNRITYLAPRLLKGPKKKDFYAVGFDYEKNRNFKKGRKYYKKIINGRFNFERKIKAWNRLRLSYKKERNKEDYIKMTKKMGQFIKRFIKRKSKNKIYLKEFGENQINLARAIWTNHNREKAKVVLINLKKYQSLNDEIHAQIEWLLGNMALETKNNKLALTHFEAASQYKIDNNEISERIHWSLGWNHYILGNYKNALLAFEKFSEKTENYYIKNKLRFWSAQTLIKLKKKREGNEILRGLCENDPYGYYGVLAHKILKRPFSPIKFKNEPMNSNYPIFSWLLSLGEADDAKNYLDHLSAKIKNPKEITKFLTLYSKAQYFQKGISLFYQLAPDERQEILHEKIEFLYPNPFNDEVKEATKKFNISSPLIYSITRQESGFNPQARSWADAFGLMQLTPETAKVLAKKYKIHLDSPNDLFSPGKNILLGSGLLNDLKIKFDNQFILYVASYNASHRVVQRWKKDRFNGNHIEFIEMIPYAETMNYVKLVLRNFFIYKRLLSEKKFYFPKTFFSSEKS